MGGKEFRADLADDVSFPCLPGGRHPKKLQDCRKRSPDLALEVSPVVNDPETWMAEPAFLYLAVYEVASSAVSMRAELFSFM